MVHLRDPDVSAKYSLVLNRRKDRWWRVVPRYARMVRHESVIIRPVSDVVLWVHVVAGYAGMIGDRIQ